MLVYLDSFDASSWQREWSREADYDVIDNLNDRYLTWQGLEEAVEGVVKANPHLVRIVRWVGE